MKGTVALFGEIKGRSAAVLLKDGRLEDLLIDPPEGRIVPGTIYRAKAGRPMKGQGGMFLETPDGPLFLRQSKGLAPGTSLLVQTTTFAEPGKATPATTKLSIKCRYVLATPGAPGLNISRSIRDEERRVELQELAGSLDIEEGTGLIVRSAAADADDDAILSDAEAMLEVMRDLMSETDGAPERLLDGPDAEEIAFREWPVPDQTITDAGAFADFGVEAMVDALRHGEQPLPGGGSLYIEPTRALVAVDVNTGGDTSPAAGLKTNIAAVRALPQILRLRGLGGQIVVDMAPMPKRDRVRVEQQIRTALRADVIETAFVGWTPLGHAEFQRKRERLPLEEVLS